MTERTLVLTVAAAAFIHLASPATAEPIVQLTQLDTKEDSKGFRDDFNGKKLADHWEVINPNPDAYIVEDGSLLIISGTPGSLSKGNVENIVRLTKPLPKGDWTATMKFKMGYFTGSETAYLALYNDKDNYIGAFVASRSAYSGISGAGMFFYGMKLSKGKTNWFEKRIWGGSSGVPFTADSPPNPYLVRLKKVGRSYIPAVKMLGVKKKDGTESVWIEYEKFTVLRPKGNLVIGIYQSRNVTGETTANIDWIKIETPR